MDKKVSIIVPCYGTEEYIDRCIDSLLNQTYKNIEIILVNDASPNGMEKILENYKKKSNKIKVITHEKNKGLFHARISGADNSTGDYICFVDSDDYISIDYIRSLVYDMEEKHADMIFSNTILEDNNEQRIYNLFEFHIDEILDENCLKNYFAQRGLNYRWHTIWNKLYKIELWKKARKYYNEIKTNLIMTEDFAFSTVLFYFCKKIIFNEYANYYYCTNNSSSTSLVKVNYNKFNKNINDLITSFEFVKNFMKKVDIYLKYKDEFETWYNIYLRIWYNNVINSKLNKKEKENLLTILYEKNQNISTFEYKNQTNFYNTTTLYNNGYEEIICQIIKSNTVSFDIFDTLILRPFYEPKDLFKLLNKKFNDLSKNNTSFSTIREEAEHICRKIVKEKNNYEEITLDEIYNYISKKNNINTKITNELKQYEIELELKYCYPRKSGKNLFNLAKYLNKRVIITSDIYMPKEIIQKLLQKNGYINIDKIYLSSEEKVSKATGNLYAILLKNEKDHSIIHIGDNYVSDCQNAQKNKINSIQLPKATDILWPKIYSIFSNNSYYVDSSVFLSYSGIRNSLALVANKFFDNPFTSFEEKSTFNCDPAYIGYFALGMHTFAVTKWIYDNVLDYDSLTFMARDGYLIKKEFEILKKYFNNKIKTNYLPISRKALLPFSFETKEEFIGLLNYFAYDHTSPYDIYNILTSIMKKTPNNTKKMFKTKTEFSQFIINNIIPNIDEEKMNKNRETIKKYFSHFYEGKAANFDIGYSGKPEKTLSSILEKPIDTFFIHTNNDDGYNYSKDTFKLKTFYDFKPRFTGLLREYILSELTGSCIKYEIINDVKPIYENNKINYYEKWIIDLIQQNAINFTKDMLDNYGDMLEDLCFPNYYMSLPFEYYMHASEAYDKLVFKGLIFEDSINNYIDIEKIWTDICLTTNKKQDITFESITQNFYNLQVANRNKLIKIFYYVFFNRVALRRKIKKKLGKNNKITKKLIKFRKMIKK